MAFCSAITFRPVQLFLSRDTAFGIPPRLSDLHGQAKQTTRHAAHIAYIEKLID